MSDIVGKLKDKNGNNFYPQTDATLVAGLSTVAMTGSYNDLNDAPIVDDTPVQDSDNLVTSGGVYNALLNKQDTINSTNKLSADLLTNGNTNKVFTATEQSKLASIEDGAEVNVNADWNASSGDAEILNKPTLGTAASKDVPVNGNASTSEVVLGNDTRLLPSLSQSDNGKIMIVENGESLFKTPCYNDERTLVSDISLSSIIDSSQYLDTNIILHASANTRITIDRYASCENRFILHNTSASSITFIFDFDSINVTQFSGDAGYANRSMLVIPIQISSFTMLEFRVMSNGMINYSVNSLSYYNRQTQGLFLDESELLDDDVALVIVDSDTGDLKFLTIEDYDEYHPNLTGITVKPYVRFHRGKNGKPVVIHSSQETSTWASDNRYKLECDTTSAGGFSWAITINGSAKSGSVSWVVDDTLDDIVMQMTSISYLTFSHISGENFIRISSSGYSNSEFILSNNTGATLTDLSKFTKINDVLQSETHRTWQAQDVSSMFPNLGFLAANTALYAKNGYNLSNMCGANLSKYKSWANASGSNTYVAENSASSRMKESTFNALNNDGVQEHQDLYDKYTGSWDAYMRASMVALDDTHTNGMEYQSYDNGDDQASKLESVMTMDFDGTYYCPFSAENKCCAVTDDKVIGGRFHLPTIHEAAVFMNDDILAKINSVFYILSTLGFTTYNLSNTSNYWSVAQYTAHNSWFYNGNHGRLLTDKYNTNSVRALAYINS